METPTHDQRIVILAGGTLDTDPAPAGATVIAADSGYDHALALGIPVDLLVGDMDSISEEGLAHAKGSTTVETHPGDKDHTDLELAIAAAIRLGATRIDVHGAGGGRIGHLLGVALGLTAPTEAEVHWHTATGVITAARPGHPVVVDGAVGDVVSLVPAGDVGGATTTGLRWQLTDADLPAGTTRGMSNTMTEPHATITIRSGALLVIAEGAQA